MRGRVMALYSICFLGSSLIGLQRHNFPAHITQKSQIGTIPTFRGASDLSHQWIRCRSEVAGLGFQPPTQLHRLRPRFPQRLLLPQKSIDSEIDFLVGGPCDDCREITRRTTALRQIVLDPTNT
jgi:hypothetical protein